MNYIVYDLEFNQDFSAPGERRVNSCKRLNRPCFEIIQVGAVKLSRDFTPKAAFDRYVKPTIYPEISPFITELTRITTEQLAKEAAFPQVYQDMIEFIGQEDSVLCVWGMSDLKELFRNIDYHKLDRKLMPRNYINLQPYASLHFQLPQNRPMKLRTTAEMLEIPLVHPFHNAYNDAFYTAEILKKLYGPSVVPNIYDPDFKPHRPRPAKKRVDLKKLIEQFEKMYERQLTEEEQGMIQLAYKMGKTRQFLK